VRLRLTALLSALLLLAAIPAGAQTDPEPEPNRECTGSGTALTAEGLTTTIATPSLVTGDTLEQFRLDLAAPASENARASVTVTMTWGVPTNDYDLDVNGQTSVGLQPLDAAEETVTVAVGNCGTVDVRAYEFLAPVLVDTVTLDIRVTRR
jgi:hypothetical protein